MFVIAAGLSAAWALTLAGSAAALPSNCAQSGNTVTCTFNYTGKNQTWTVPTGVTDATFDALGAAGGSSGLLIGLDGEGLGGEATADLGLTGVTTVTLVVGGQGEIAQLDVGGGVTDFCDANGSVNPGAGGFNGGAAGGAGYCPGSGGGGASDVRIGGDALSNRALVAGGGGGNSDCINSRGGGGGGLTGEAGTGPSSCNPSGSPGSGGNQDGTSGSGQLGDGSPGGSGDPSVGSSGGGGGGGGYYGGEGGGGGGTGGGGGSGFGPAATTFQTGVHSGNGVITVSYQLPTPSISTSQQPASATVGSSIADQATVSGVANPTGTVTFNLYNNPNATGTPLFTDANEPLLNGTATSKGYTTTATGTDYWVASYNGDSNNSSVASGPADEPVTVTSATPSISTSQQPASAVLGSSIADKATVSGGFNPTGTVTFNLYNNPNGTGTPLFTDTETLANGTATSKGYTATATGTDYWVASYNGDSNNSSVASGPADEPVTVTPATPSISTSQQPASATVGSLIADKATVSGGFSPTGTVTFNVYNNANATGTPLFTDANEPLVNGTATSKGYTTTATGTDYWVASYNGDSNNSSVASGPADEPVTVTPATPSISTSQQPASAVLGSSIADQATVSGGYKPTGTVTFNLYNNPNATGTPLYSDTETLANGTATSKGYTATATGTDYWGATYNGDSNNSKATSGSAAEPVSVAYGFGGFMSPLPKSTLLKSGSTIPVKFVLTDNSGHPIAASTAAALASAGNVEATLAGPKINPQTALCAWNSMNLAYQCNIKTPSGLQTGISNPYTITVAENVGGGFIHAPPVGTAVNPETVYFK